MTEFPHGSSADPSLTKGNDDVKTEHVKVSIGESTRLDANETIGNLEDIGFPQGDGFNRIGRISLVGGQHIEVIAHINPNTHEPDLYYLVGVAEKPREQTDDAPQYERQGFVILKDGTRFGRSRVGSIDGRPVNVSVDSEQLGLVGLKNSISREHLEFSIVDGHVIVKNISKSAEAGAIDVTRPVNDIDITIPNGNKEKMKKDLPAAEEIGEAAVASEIEIPEEDIVLGKSAAQRIIDRDVHEVRSGEGQKVEVALPKVQVPQPKREKRVEEPRTEMPSTALREALKGENPLELINETHAKLTQFRNRLRIIETPDRSHVTNDYSDLQTVINALDAARTDLTITFNSEKPNVDVIQQASLILRRSREFIKEIDHNHMPVCEGVSRDLQDPGSIIGRLSGATYEAKQASRDIEFGALSDDERALYEFCDLFEVNAVGELRHRMFNFMDGFNDGLLHQDFDSLIRLLSNGGYSGVSNNVRAITERLADVHSKLRSAESQTNYVLELLEKARNAFEHMRAVEEQKSS